jgi:diguanylate cyclase (GGDEF)-like protein
VVSIADILYDTVSERNGIARGPLPDDVQQRCQARVLRADDAGVGRSAAEPFTDPLSAVLPDGAARARGRLRLAGALLFGSGAVTLAGVLFAPDPDTSDHPALAVCAAAFAAVALALVAWRRAPRAVLHGICPAGTLAVTAAVALAQPIGLTPCFYLWPMIVAAYFLGRREVAANLVFAAAACAISLALWVDPGLRVAMFVAVLAIVGVATAVIVVLREQVLALVLRLRALASHDSLTGALNRGAFEQRLESELARARRTATPLSLVVFDVDHFKRLNDSLGHAAGDAALRSIGDIVASAMRGSDVFGRLGGEEFGLLLPNTAIDAAATVAAELRLRLAAPTAGRRPLTVSFGVAEAHAGASGSRAMFDEADRAMYAAKHAGRDRVIRSDELPAAA